MYHDKRDEHERNERNERNERDKRNDQDAASDAAYCSVSDYTARDAENAEYNRRVDAVVRHVFREHDQGPASLEAYSEALALCVELVLRRDEFDDTELGPRTDYIIYGLPRRCSQYAYIYVQPLT